MNLKLPSLTVKQEMELVFLNTDFSYREVLNFVCVEYKLEIPLDVRNVRTEHRNRR